MCCINENIAGFNGNALLENPLISKIKSSRNFHRQIHAHVVYYKYKSSQLNIDIISTSKGMVVIGLM